eukprot:6211150-Pleurochrysis_carterae.AAC.3
MSDSCLILPYVINTMRESVRAEMGSNTSAALGARTADVVDAVGESQVPVTSAEHGLIRVFCDGAQRTSCAARFAALSEDRFLSRTTGSSAKTSGTATEIDHTSLLGGVVATMRSVVPGDDTYAQSTKTGIRISGSYRDTVGQQLCGQQNKSKLKPDGTSDTSFINSRSKVSRS